MYSANCKMMIKEVEDNMNRWKDILCSRIGRIKIVEMTLLSRAICRFNAVPMKILIFFMYLEQIFFKFVGKHKSPQVAKVVLRKKNGAGGITLRLQSYSMVLAQNSQIDQ